MLGTISSVPKQGGNVASRWLLVAALVYTLICAVGMIGSGFKGATAGEAKELFAFATNPFMGLIIGIVATALIQSSSTVTSIIVGLVAGGLPVELAVPMVMGANVGTSITNTIVSMGHITNKEEFKRAFAAATIHDYFNLLSVVIFLPLEIMFGLLEKIGTYLASFLVSSSAASAEVSVGSFNFVKAATKPVVNTFKSLTGMLDQPLAGILLAILGVTLIFVSITYIGKLLKQLMVGKAKDIMHTTVGRGPISGIASGTVITVLVQSSSTTTSLMVPLAGSGTFGLRQIYPFTLGANIGTCITALIASFAVEGNMQAAVTIALIHLTYNVIGVIVIYGIPVLRNIPIKLATWLAELVSEKKVYALVYILGVFFVIPLLCVGISYAVGATA
ncbi:Na/Pi symporter [Psychrobacter phenylpyruvicus]|uniref:Sodium-dependent inorganic phosphate (Pi) transporter n=1 Tax=Psychrobacter phenylpyruvicus TaxID=29432 RepID=A0A379LPN5_9GAMM|nr:Na/Pi symporter [Psychrobacter phenylpyruvicus]SUD91724.1 sodium-dependent inorganic phosphate (Pi) transporter [Psychrobacter phenylpyruvicus]